MTPQNKLTTQNLKPENEKPKTYDRKTNDLLTELFLEATQLSCDVPEFFG